MSLSEFLSPRLTLHRTLQELAGRAQSMKEASPWHRAPGSRRPWGCQQPSGGQAAEKASSASGLRGSLGRRGAFQRCGGLQPVCLGLSHGGGARSRPAHSPQRQGGRGVWVIPEGQGPGLAARTQEAPQLREGLERSAPSQVGCCPDSACCRKSAPPYLEPCS